MYFLRRIGFAIPLLLLISFLAFVLVRMAPGGPFDRERAAASPEVERQLKQKYRLDEPLWKQYGYFLGNLLRGDLGPSLRYRNHTVNDIVAEALPVSMLLGMLAFGFALGVGLPLGFFSAVHRGRWQDWAGSFAALLAVCIPGLVLAPLLVVTVAIKWRLLPVGLWGSPWHAVLPTIALGLFFAGKVARLMREGMLGVMQSEFITTARAKGLGEHQVMLRHAFRLAVLPVVSYCGPLLADLLTGSFVVENIFQIPGIGTFFVNSMVNRDHTMTVGLVLLYAVLLVLLNLLVDFIHAALDPRIRYA
ncbi:MAG TPA: ABC transporter permease [Verrucomicrobia bacterium]|nr:ABC transporter permease [Verrucomicrobiota bacterium]HOB33360.1 ABC transporter permease [Verrucomicrobiota bacterium]HOP97636.1 ABC transporter permease [Verrucomicrobiota bacterium]HPU57613.1 ABC transporter permease [Verrucomicrobiota bacterium]